MNCRHAAEFIKGRFYFISLRNEEIPKSNQFTHYFCTDEELVYESFFCDFGPLNLAMLYHYCNKVNKKLLSPALHKKQIMHYTSCNKQKRVNASFLVASYAILYLHYTPRQAFDLLRTNNCEPFVDFRDASLGVPYYISLLDCLNAVKKAYDVGFFSFDNFDYLEYEHYERVENGDLNWIVPNKFIGFCGPHNKSKIDNGYPLHSPETYFSYFRRNNVSTIIRLNKKVYDANKFINAGFDHKDLYFIDGSTPSDRIVRQFIEICEKTDGAIAVHCKAGLGRTGSLIGCYIMKHYKFTARETIAWIRLCRPGSIIGHQQEWLESKQEQMWRAGEEYRRSKNLEGPRRHLVGVYSFISKKVIDYNQISSSDNVSGILKKVDTMKLNDREENVETEKNGEGLTQGDRLNRIKAQRRQTRSFATVLNNDRKLFQSRVMVTTLEPASVLRAGKILNSRIKAPTTSGTKVVAKRTTVTNEAQMGVCCRRLTQRKVTMASSPHINGNTSDLTKSNNTKGATKKGKSPDWNVATNNTNFTASNSNTRESNTDRKSETRVIKRSKRSLNLEKDKISTRSIKVLRRSHPLNANEAKIKNSLQFVNKTSKTP